MNAQQPEDDLLGRAMHLLHEAMMRWDENKRPKPRMIAVGLDFQPVFYNLSGCNNPDVVYFIPVASA